MLMLCCYCFHRWHIRTKLKFCIIIRYFFIIIYIQHCNAFRLLICLYFLLLLYLKSLYQDFFLQLSPCTRFIMFRHRNAVSKVCVCVFVSERTWGVLSLIDKTIKMCQSIFFFWNVLLTCTRTYNFYLLINLCKIRKEKYSPEGWLVSHIINIYVRETCCERIYNKFCNNYLFIYSNNSKYTLEDINIVLDHWMV